MPIFFGILLLLANLQNVFALNETNTFPMVSFKLFSIFIEETFGPTVSLSTVLLLMFSVLENPELFSLHARQQCPRFEGETRSSASGWIKQMALALQNRLGDNSQQLF